MKLTKFKKTFALFFSLVLIAVVVYAVQTLTLEIDDKTEFAGTNDVSIPVFLDNDVSVAGLQLNIDHTDYLIFKSVQATERMPDSTFETNDVDGTIKIAALIENGISAGEGAIMNLIFDVASDSVAGDYNLQIADVITANINTTTFSTDSLQGVFTILVDTDGDGIDDSTDSCPTVYGCSLHSGCSFGFSEWLPPISNFDEFDLQLGATLPLKFSAIDCSSVFYEDSDVLVRVVNESLGTDKYYNASGEGTDYIRINSTEEQYITNIHTGQLNMSLGMYDAIAIFSNGLESAIGFELVQQGPSNGKGKGKQK